MQIKQVNFGLTVSDQVTPSNIIELSNYGIKSIICNRPNHEAKGENSIYKIQTCANKLGIELHYLPVDHATINENDVNTFELTYMSTPKPVHAYCRSGMKAITLSSLMMIKQGRNVDAVIANAQKLGYDFKNFRNRFASVIKKYTSKSSTGDLNYDYDIAIVGAGSAGISVASSLLERKKNLKIAIIDPAETHYYQPGFTMVGAGVFTLSQTQRKLENVIPKKVSWIKASVTELSPEHNYVILDNGTPVSYQRLIVCPGIKLHWEGIEGLSETLGKNGVTSNYSADCSAYTWELVQSLDSGKALFTQPPMPIKCAGAPQKAMYLSADYWLTHNKLNNIDIEFYNAGAALFGVKAYLPALQSYIDRYNAKLCFNHKLVKIDGPNKTAWFEKVNIDGRTTQVERHFDMIHVCPPQIAPDFIRTSKLADESGWIDVDQFTLRHKSYTNIWSLGDVINTPNAKTTAAVRKQVPVVASNIIADIENKSRHEEFTYDGYGSCPLTVERGKIVLAEFIYNGELSPTFPQWLIDGTKPSYLAWLLKVKILPIVYWNGMLKGHEWLAKPKNKIKKHFVKSKALGKGSVS